MIKILKIFFVLIFIIVFSNTTFSSSGKINANNNKTITELKKEIKEINKQKERSMIQLDNLEKELLVKKFFKLDLNQSKRDKLNKIIYNYKLKDAEIKKQIEIKTQKLENIVELKKQLLENEKDFYGKLIEYIDINKYREYIVYIKQRLIILNKKLDLDNSGKVKEIIIKKKVDNLKEKIVKNNELINKNTIEIINNKINKLLEKIIQKDKYKNLSKKGKIMLFDALSEKISYKIDKLKETKNKSKTIELIINNKDSIIKNIELFKEKHLK